MKGNLSDKTAVQKALEKADFKSVRGNFKFGNNHIPIQNFYLQDVVKDEGRRLTCSRPSPPSSRTVRTLSRQVPDEVIMAQGCGRQKRDVSAVVRVIETPRTRMTRFSPLDRVELARPE